MSLKRYIIIFLLMLLPLEVSANVPEETHWILQKLAQTTYREVTVLGDKLALKVPEAWLSRNGTEGGFIMTDPLFESVISGVYRTQHVEKIEAEIGKRFLSTFEVTERSSITLAGGEQAERFILSGRVGGERTLVLAASVSSPDGSMIIYFAEAPEGWFKSYQPVFEDILLSVHSI